MSRAVLIQRAAELDLGSAHDWYLKESDSLAMRFEGEVDAAMVSITRNPEMYPRVRGDIRRAMTRSFPYAIYFIVDERRISVLRVLHQARDAKKELRRRRSE